MTALRADVAPALADVAAGLTSSLPLCCIAASAASATAGAALGIALGIALARRHMAWRLDRRQTLRHDFRTINSLEDFVL